MEGEEHMSWLYASRYPQDHDKYTNQRNGISEKTKYIPEVCSR